MQQLQIKGLYKTLAYLSTLLVAAPLATAAVLEEIIVTAQKREQDLSDVSISITAFSGAQLRALNIANSIDLDDQTPGLIVTEYGGSTTTVFNIRGSSQLDFNDQQEPPVAVYVDGAYISLLAGVGFNFFDLERVEVLRGSQGTLFGRNATGGLVHLISAKPTKEFEGYAELTGGDFGMIKGEAAVSGPLGDGLSGRLSVFHESNDGFVENDIGDDPYNRNNYSGRAQLLFEPNDDLSVLVSGRWSIDDSEGGIYDTYAGITDFSDGYIRAVEPRGPVTEAEYVAYCTALLTTINFVPGPPGGTRPGSGDCFNATPNNRDPYKTSADAPSFFEREHFGGTVTIDYDVGPGTLTSITDLQDFKKDYSEDAGSTPINLWHFTANVDATQWSQELRFAGEAEWGRYILGAYYLSIETDGGATLDSINTFGLTFDNGFELETETYAFFSQVEVDLMDKLTVIGGFRWTEDEKEFSLRVGCGFDFLANAPATAENCSFFAPLVQGTGLPRTKRSEGDWSGNIELNWKPNDDLMAYGKVSRGHKAGGFNGGIIDFFLPDGVTYDSELPVTYEGGFKATLFGGKARLNTAVFYTDYKDFQTFTQIGPNLSVFNVDAEILGSEIELFLNPWEGWDFIFGISLLDAQQQDLTGPGGTLDRDMPNAPDVSFNALARYEWPALGGTMNIQADMNYLDDRALEANNHPGLKGESYVLGNANLGWTTADEKWDFKLWVRNIADKFYYHTIFDLTTISGQIEPVVGAPRWFGGTIGYRF